MARKSVFSREDVVVAALVVVQAQGIEKMTARGVADQLDASTAPVYSNFQNMDDLEKAVLKKAGDLLLEYMQAQRTDNVFMNMGLGMLYFAREQRNLYWSLFLDRNSRREVGTELVDTLLDILNKDGQYEDLSPRQRERLLIKMGIFTQGLAVRVCTSTEEEFCVDQMRELLEEVGHVLTEDAQDRSRAEIENPEEGKDLNESQDSDDATGCCL